MRFSSLAAVCWFLLIAVAMAGEARAGPTEVEVRVLARGAKFLGGYSAPVRVVLTDADTGETLAQGLTSGTTGDTQSIMAEGANRRRTISTKDSASFRTSLDIDRPRRVTLSVEGPLSQPQATTKATSTQWILPGRHLTAGDGWLMELPGLIVDVASPVAYQSVKAGTTLSLRAGVTMLCGCAISQGGPWLASDTEVEAYVRVDGAGSRRYPLRFESASGTFGADIPAGEPGLYEVEIRAWMGPSNNAGVARTAFFVR